MGANQSANDDTGNGSCNTQKEMKTCYYDVLGIERQATEDEIKKAYRKKALELHPDRNYGRVEETTKLFAEVQAAYEILSDTHERAWYDSHRDAILRDDDEGAGDHYENNTRVTTADDIMKLFSRFNGRMDYSDSPNGFYGALRETFEGLAREEDSACDWEGLETVDYPSFGGTDDPYEDEVKNFYAAWNGFSTRKTFSWKDKYRYADAPDRRVRRAMEKENKRSREEGIREFNDAVRSLVAFVRKRDPRYTPNTQTEAERQKILRDAAAAQAARSRAANQVKLDGHVLPEWTQIREPVEEDSEEEEIEEEIFECVVCGKMFKSEKQFEAHERSKKHMKIVQQLRRKMEKEDKALNASLGEKSDKPSPSPADVSDGDMVEEIDEGADLISPLNDEDDHLEGLSGQSERDDGARESRSKEAIESKARISGEVSLSGSEEIDDDYAPRTEVENRITGDEITNCSSGLPDEKAIPATSESFENDTTPATSDADKSAPKQKIGKAKEKRLKRAAAQHKKGGQSGEGGEFQCAACKTGFPSKTKLFAHVKELNHAQPVPSQQRKATRSKR